MKKYLLIAISIALSGMLHAITITNWNSTKTNDQDLVFLVNQGEQITFSVGTDLVPGEYVWTVNQVQQAGNSSTFTWTVPNGDSTWNITVAVSEPNTPVVGVDSSKYASQTWTVTTTEIKQVSPGSSIQTAINDLSVAGGVVELMSGTFNITSPIWINKNNIVIRGQGIDITQINQLNTNTDGIIVSTFYDYQTRVSWLYQNGIKWTVMLQWFIDHPDEVVKNTMIRNLSIYTPGSTARFAGIAGCEVTNLTISKVKITGNATSNYPWGLSINYFVDVTVDNSIISGTGEPITFFGGCYRGNVINCSISGGKQFTVIQYNGVSGKDGIPAMVKGNRLYSNFGSLYVYSSADVLVTQNLVENSNGQYGAIFIALPIGQHTVSNNFVRNVVYDANPFSAGILVTQKYIGDIAPNIITGNIIYNAKTHGIAFYADPADTTLNIKDIVTSNTIINSGGDGISNPQGQLITTVKNNIIVNSGGYGINNVTNNSYNDVYNNALGNYYGTNPGAGAISLDPLFADTANFDFHLQSQSGRWNGSHRVNDAVNSPCIDAGDPLDNYSNEPLPNGGRINMGAYGNTIEASKSAGATEQPLIDFALYQNYPNPFNQETNITFDLPTNSFVSLKIFNLIGQEVAVLVNGQLPAGTHNYKVGREQFGLASGVYFYRIAIHSDRLSAGEFVQTRKMLMLK